MKEEKGDHFSCITLFLRHTHQCSTERDKPGNRDEVSYIYDPNINKRNCQMKYALFNIVTKPCETSQEKLHVKRITL